VRLHSIIGAKHLLRVSATLAGPVRPRHRVKVPGTDLRIYYQSLLFHCIGATHRIAASRVGSRDDSQQCNNSIRGTHAKGAAMGTHASVAGETKITFLEMVDDRKSNPSLRSAVIARVIE